MNHDPICEFDYTAFVHFGKKTSPKQPKEKKKKTNCKNDNTPVLEPVISRKTFIGGQAQWVAPAIPALSEAEVTGRSSDLGRLRLTWKTWRNPSILKKKKN